MAQLAWPPKRRKKRFPSLAVPELRELRQLRKDPVEEITVHDSLPAPTVMSLYSAATMPAPTAAQKKAYGTLETAAQIT